MPRRSAQSTRRVGRPPGGGKPADQARAELLDAAERSLLTHGYRGSTMESIAHAAGCTRTIIYRHFANRDELMGAVVRRYTTRQARHIMDRLDDAPDLATKIVEAFVVVATELVDDPIYTILSERTESGTVGGLLSAATPLVSAVDAMLDDVADGPAGEVLRPGLQTLDAAHFLILSALSLLSGQVPGSRDPAQVRRYVRVFLLPALLAHPPAAEAVFAPS
ncbi:hypothetical protein BHQ15_09935 [Mycolicibacillus koreensis]|nr:hypothetical protein BHQ15_09935 [Mycolicibacillus koreensis]